MAGLLEGILTSPVGRKVAAKAGLAEPPRLRVAQIRARAHHKILLQPRAPRLNVARLHLQIGQIARAALQLPHRDLQIAEQLHGGRIAVIHIGDALTINISAQHVAGGI